MRDPEDDRRACSRRTTCSTTARNSPQLCARAGVAAEAGEIVTFGVTPDHPATGYGYIHPAEPLAIDPAGPAGRALRREAGRGARQGLHRERLFVELGQFRVPRRRDARGVANIRAGDRRGDERGRRAGETGSRLRDPRQGSLRQGAENLDRLCGDGADRISPRCWPPTSAGRTSANGRLSGG